MYTESKPASPSSTAGTGTYAAAEALLNWYVLNALSSRRRYLISEVGLLVASTAVPVVGILSPHDARGPAVIGAIVVMLSGLRSIFHWRDNWIRFTVAGAAIKSELRLYDSEAAPYADASTRLASLVSRLNTIEMNETQAWTTLTDRGARDLARPKENGP